MKKHTLFLFLVGIPVATIITVVILINYFVFSSVPHGDYISDYYSHTHTTTHNLNEAVKMTENQLPLDKIRIYEPVSEDYTLEHIYGSSLFKDRISFSINLLYSTNQADMINIFIPFKDDRKIEYLLDNYYIDEEGNQKTKDDKYIVNVNSGNIDYFIKSNIDNHDYVMKSKWWITCTLPLTCNS